MSSVQAFLLSIVVAGANGSGLTSAPQAPFEGHLSPGETRTQLLSFDAGQYYRAYVEQVHLDLVVRVIGPDGSTVAEVDNRADREEPLSLSIISAQAGPYRLEIRLRETAARSARYRLTTEGPRAATGSDQQRIAAERSRAEADLLAAKDTAPSLQAALARYQALLPRWQAIGDRAEEAATLARIADVQAAGGETRMALASVEQELALWRALGSRRGEAAALTYVGLAHSELGEQPVAIAFLEQALALRRAEADERGQAEALNDIAVALGAQGKLPEAIARYTEALQLARAAGDRFGEAEIIKNRAGDYRGLGETARAMADLNECLARFRAMGNQREEGVTEYAVGNVYLDTGDPRQALRHYQRALRRLQQAGDRRFEGFDLDHIGLAHLALRRPAEALADFEKALALLAVGEDRRAEAMTRANIGRAHLEGGAWRLGRDQLLSALPMVRASGDRIHEAVVLAQLAQAERKLGDLEAARQRIEESLALTESLRSSIPAPGERAAFMARSHQRYALAVDLLVALDAAQAGQGWDALALQASERARARTLLDLLAEARVDLREGADPALLEREQSLAEAVDQKSAALARVAGDPSHGSEAAALRAELRSSVSELDEVRDRIRSHSPRYAALALPQPLNLAGIQREVVDADSILLEYFLGDERSVLWAVGPDWIATRILPARSKVEAAARQLYALWRTAAPDVVAEGPLSVAVSQMLLGPVADRLSDKRLLIAADGALLYLPFAALPLPEGSGQGRGRLIDKHEVVMLPSASALAALRRDASERRPAPLTVAVFADPVFDRWDARVARSANAQSRQALPLGLERSAKESGVEQLNRLPATRREAEAIVALVPSHEGMAALDFRASRPSAMDPELARYGIVHFATHGLLNSQHPEMSGLVLSLVDEQGNEQNGFLRTGDIFRLRLGADLVVLSACQTALGKEVRGEGLLGLTQGFMYAGARRVVASLWRVSDRSTAELMRRFYRALLVEKLAPAAALRAAQLDLSRTRSMDSPHDWAAFTLQGEWHVPAAPVETSAPTP